MTSVLLIDNYDSFTYNLAHLFGELGAEVVVRRNDEIDLDEAETLSPSHLVVSPGPGRPEEAGVSNEIIRGMSDRVRTLGVPLAGTCRACDRVHRGARPFALDERLGRGADEREAVELEQEEVRRRVDAPQRTVDAEW